jgi:hypothetical protein
MHLFRILYGMALLLILGLALSGCGGGTTNPITPGPLPDAGDIQVGLADATFTPAENLALNFVTADFESVNDVAGLSRAKLLVPEVPFTYDDVSKSWTLIFSTGNHPQVMENYGTLDGQFYMTVYVLVEGETVRRQVGSRYLVNLDIPVEGDIPDDGSGPPPPPWPN